MMKTKPHLLYPLDIIGYPYGVSAVAPGLGTELHGPFKTADLALNYARQLREEFADYGEITVVKIETPSVNMTTVGEAGHIRPAVV